VSANSTVAHRRTIRLRLAVMAALPPAFFLLTWGVILWVKAEERAATDDALEWSHHAIEAERVAAAANGYLAALATRLAGAVAPRDDLSARAKSLGEAKRRSAERASRFSAEEQAEEAELGEALANLVERGAEAARSKDPAAAAGLGELYDTHVAPLIEKRVKEELEGSEATLEKSRLLERRLFTGLALAGLAVLAVYLTLGALFARRLSRTLAELQDRATDIADGQLDQAIAIRSDDELGAVASAFNRMSIALRNTLVTRDELARTVEQRTRELQEASAKLMASERMASVGLLAAGVAHEVNNPLAFMLANLAFCRESLQRWAGREPGDAAVPSPASHVEEVLSAVNEVYQGGERIRDIVRDLKTFARPSDDSREAVDLPAVVGSTLAMASTLVQQRAQLVTDIQPVPPVWGNESRLAQVVLNLVVNAVQALPGERGDENRIRVSTRLESGNVVVEVEDNGSGIPPDLRPRLFTPFFTTKPAGTGTGLGLSICRNIVEAHGGAISLDSEVERGTRFRIHLPPAPAVAQPPAPVVHLPPQPSGARVLVVDDEPSVCSALRRLLVEHRVETTEDPRRALDRLVRGEHFDAVLCDLMMPGLTGMELHAELRRTRPAMAERVLFITGGAFTGAARSFVEEMGDRVLEKPCDPQRVRAAIQKLLDAVAAPAA